MKNVKKRVFWSIGAVVTVSLLVIGIDGYLEYQRRNEIAARKGPFAEVFVLARAAGDADLIKQGLISGSGVTSPGCSLETCTDMISTYKIGPRGEVRVALNGKRLAAMEGKTVVLRPEITNRVATWACITDVDVNWVPQARDRLPPGLRGIACEVGPIPPSAK